MGMLKEIIKQKCATQAKLIAALAPGYKKMDFTLQQLFFVFNKNDKIRSFKYTSVTGQVIRKNN
jgi:hypothetical protein